MLILGVRNVAHVSSEVLTDLPRINHQFGIVVLTRRAFNCLQKQLVEFAALILNEEVIEAARFETRISVVGAATLRRK